MSPHLRYYKFFMRGDSNHAPAIRSLLMKYHKLRAGEKSGNYVMESPVTEADTL